MGIGHSIEKYGWLPEAHTESSAAHILLTVAGVALLFVVTRVAGL